MRVLYLINTQMGKEYEVRDRMKQYKEVSEMYLLFDVYDALLIANFGDNEEAKKFRRKIGNDKGIRTVVSLVDTKA